MKGRHAYLCATRVDVVDALRFIILEEGKVGCPPAPPALFRHRHPVSIAINPHNTSLIVYRAQTKGGEGRRKGHVTHLLATSAMPSRLLGASPPASAAVSISGSTGTSGGTYSGNAGRLPFNRTITRLNNPVWPGEPRWFIDRQRVSHLRLLPATHSLPCYRCKGVGWRVILDSLCVASHLQLLDGTVYSQSGDV